MIQRKLAQLIALTFSVLAMFITSAEPPGGGYNYCGPGNFNPRYVIPVGFYTEGCYAVTIFSEYNCSSGVSSYVGSFTTRFRIRACV